LYGISYVYNMNPSLARYTVELHIISVVSQQWITWNLCMFASAITLISGSRRKCQCKDSR